MAAYPYDIQASFVEELVQFSEYIKVTGECSPFQLLKLIRDNKLECVFPNTDIALRIYLTVPVTNCEGERSFSTMSRVQNLLRSTMGQERMSALSLLSIEGDLLREINFNDVIKDFSEQKCRKKSL